MIRIPPGGFAGFAQMTPASRLALREAVGTTAGPKRRRPRRAAAARKNGARRSRAATKRKLKFGSPAWRKKYMRKGAKRKR